VKKSTNLAALYGELGRVTLSIYRKYNMVKYWKKMLSLNENSIVKKVYNALKVDDLNNKTYRNKTGLSK